LAKSRSRKSIGERRNARSSDRLTCTDRAELVSRPATPMLFCSMIILPTILHAPSDRDRGSNAAVI
jgi:hypothetical protein